MQSSVVHPQKLLDYDRVQEIINGKDDKELSGEILQKLRDLNELALGLRAVRMKDGALDLNMPEITCRLDDDEELKRHRHRVHRDRPGLQ